MRQPVQDPPVIQNLSPAEALGDQAYAAIREAITAGRLVPGTKVTERHLAKQLGVSPTPIREALRRLEQEQLVIRSGRERRVTALTEGSSADIGVIFAALQGIAARLAAQNADDAELLEIERALRSAEAGRGTASTEKTVARMQHFHRLIERASHSPVLVSLVDTVRAFDLSYRARSLRRQAKEAPKALAARRRTHGQIVQALKARDGERAEALARSHALDAFRAYRTYSD
jgi:DNA-binding GntR family transcriptional regulator